MKNLNNHRLPSSFDGEKVKIDTERGEVYKKSSDLEFTTLNYFGEILKHRKDLMDGIKYNVVRILSYNHETKILTTKYETGVNLETALTDNIIPRKQIIFLLKEIYLFFLKVGVLQLDFAPRNVLFNIVDNSICLLDFERGKVDLAGLNKDEINFLLTFSISEELSGFFCRNEIRDILGDIFTIDVVNIRNSFIGEIPIGKRRKSIVDKIMSRRKIIEDGAEVHYYFFINYFFNLFIGQTLNDVKMIYLLEQMTFEERERQILLFINEKLGLIK